MSKYDALWLWVKENGKEQFSLSFDEIEKIAGLPIDHAFLSYKKELLAYGFEVKKISLKTKEVFFVKKP